MTTPEGLCTACSTEPCSEHKPRHVCKPVKAKLDARTPGLSKVAEELHARMAADPLTDAGPARESGAAVDQGQQELDGDGSCSSDPLKSLGLRKCVELQGETIALLTKRAEAAEARLQALQRENAALKDLILWAGGKW